MGGHAARLLGDLSPSVVNDLAAADGLREIDTVGVLPDASVELLEEQAMVNGLGHG